jgi:D-glycero-D-manno-heptose 1,7-bisphosphate phosphatase
LTDPKTRRRAVFLDRDGTICEEVGYLNHISRLQIFPFAPESIRRLNDAGIPVIVVSNQSGIARRIIPDALVRETHQRIASALSEHGAHLDAFYYCAHSRQDACACRKPLPGLLERAAREHCLALGGSYVVGDRYVDVELAHRVGATGVLVLTGYGRGEYEFHGDEWTRPPDHVVENLAGAVDVILREMT